MILGTPFVEWRWTSGTHLGGDFGFSKGEESWRYQNRPRAYYEFHR